MFTGTAPNKPNARRRRLSVFPLLLPVLAAFFLAWEPMPPDRMSDALSPWAEWISHHDRIGGRLDTLTTNAVVRTALLSAGVRSKKMTKWREHPATRLWIEELLPHRAVLAYEPRLGALSTPGWVACSWIGYRHARLRLLVDWIGLKDAIPYGQHRGRQLWELENPQGDPLILALANGMVVACLHEDRDAIRGVLDRLDGMQPRLLDVHPRALGPWRASPETADRGLWLGEGGPVAVSLFDMNRDGLEIEAWGEGLAPWLAQGEAEKAIRGFSARLVGPHAMAMARLPGGLSRLAPAGGDVLLLGYPYFGKIAMLGIPAPVLVLPASSRESAMSLADGVLRDLGDRTGLAWNRIDLPSPVGLWTYLPENPSARRWVEARHAPAAGFWDGHLVLCGSHEVLQSLRHRWDRPESTFETRDLPWRENTLLVWFDFPRLAAQLEPLLRLWGFQTAAQRRDPQALQEDVLRWNQALHEWKRLPVARVEHVIPSEIPRIRLVLGQLDVLE